MLCLIDCPYPHFLSGEGSGEALARTGKKLTDAKVKSDSWKTGRHSDGAGLYLNVSKTGSKSWVFMWNDKTIGKRREMGLGSYPDISLAMARKQADKLRVRIADGIDPLAERARLAEPTFEVCASMFLETMEPSWRNAKHRAQWHMTLGDAYCKSIRNKRVSQITTQDVLGVLTPIWNTKSETASRIRGRIERVLNFAKVKGWRDGENPAIWRGNLENVLPKRSSLTRGHHAAMDYQEIPAFMERLKSHEAMAARALEFVLYTAGRSSEVLEATWQEIDFEAEIWTIPATRMKAGKEHRVPLVPAAMALLQPLYEHRVSEFVFAGQKPNSPLSNMSMHMLLRRMKRDHVTVHGFRSSFRDWAGDKTTFAREVAEGCLAHEVGNAVERAYRRGDGLEKRRALMGAWAGYIDGTLSADIIPIRA